KYPTENGRGGGGGGGRRKGPRRRQNKLAGSGRRGCPRCPRCHPHGAGHGERGARLRVPAVTPHPHPVPCRAIKVEVYDWDRDGSHDFIGEFTTSYRELARGQSQFNVYEVVNPRKKMKKKKYLNSGTVTLLSFAVESDHTFLDYIRGGTQINFTVAIDFTASNGERSRRLLPG
uniref:C2 domain-containing protein n=1 Tax=Anser brachyrhynchus TaxID=132585 RepID=A0A8B9CHB2_9AVES